MLLIWFWEWNTLCFRVKVWNNHWSKCIYIKIKNKRRKKIAAKEYSAAKPHNENAILISQPHKDIANVFEIKTNIDSKSKILLDITIEQYLKKTFNFNQLTIQILRNFEKYNISPAYNHIGFIFDVYDEAGIADIDVPASIEKSDESMDSTLIIDHKRMDKMQQKYRINGCIKINQNKDEIASEMEEKDESLQWKKGFKVGDKIEAKDFENKWYEAEIIQIDESKIKVHFIGCSIKYDENMDIDGDKNT